MEHHEDRADLNAIAVVQRRRPATMCSPSVVPFLLSRSSIDAPGSRSRCARDGVRRLAHPATRSTPDRARRHARPRRAECFGSRRQSTSSLRPCPAGAGPAAPRCAHVPQKAYPTPNAVRTSRDVASRSSNARRSVLDQPHEGGVGDKCSRPRALVQLRFPEHARRLLNQQHEQVERLRRQMHVDLVAPQQSRRSVSRVNDPDRTLTHIPPSFPSFFPPSVAPNFRSPRASTSVCVFRFGRDANQDIGADR